MQEKLKPPSFTAFLKYFPTIELPINLTEASASAFSLNNKPLPILACDQYLAPLHKDPADGMTEFVPCVRIPETHDFHAIVYWRARLLEYEFYLVTFDKSGKTISHKRIAGTFKDSNQITHMVATIDSDWIIYIVVGQADQSDMIYNPLSSKSFNLELLATGEIIKS
jgi:hypothetical protein